MVPSLCFQSIHNFTVQDVDGVHTRLVDHFRLYGNRFLTVFERTAYEVGKKEHSLMLENLKKTLEGTRV